MPSIVATGQVTIIDQNDAKSLSAFISANGPLQQTYTSDLAATYAPDRTTTNLTLTAFVYAGNTQVAALLTGRKWSTSFGGTSIGSGTTLVLNTNPAPGSAPVTYYFEGTYTDPATGLQSFVSAQISTSIVRTGTNATYVEVFGTDTIVESDTGTKNTGYMVATLRRGSNEDTAVTRYKWYKLVNGTYELIHAANTNLSVTEPAVPGLAGSTAATFTASQLYGFKLQADYATTPNVAPALGTNVQPTAADDAILRRAVSISERAVTEIGLFKVDVVDGADTYSNTFMVYDVSDPYEVQLILPAGNTLKNGTGSTDIIPRVFSGAQRIADLTGWSFVWTFRDPEGKSAAFVNENLTVTASGIPVSANTTSTFTLNTTTAVAANFAAGGGQFIKVVKDSIVRYYETASVANNTTTNPVITLKPTPTAGTIDTYAAPVANEFINGGVVFLADRVLNTSGGAVETTAKINVTEWEIDGKGSIFCEVVRP